MTNRRSRAKAARGADTKSDEQGSPRWLTYEEAARHCRWSVAHLRNLVSAGLIPVHGPPRRRRFRQDLLDLYLRDPAASMRKFRKER